MLGLIATATATAGPRLEGFRGGGEVLEGGHGARGCRGGLHALAGLKADALTKTVGGGEGII